MIWSKNTSIRSYIGDSLFAKFKLNEALDEGLINWNIFSIGIGKIESNRNGNWMYSNDWDEILDKWEKEYLENN